jgi:hypothetical protein
VSVRIQFLPIYSSYHNNPAASGYMWFNDTIVILNTAMFNAAVSAEPYCCINQLFSKNQLFSIVRYKFAAIFPYYCAIDIEPTDYVLTH